MNMSPFTKMLIGLAAVCVAITVITANNLSAIMMLKAAKNNEANKGNVVVQQQQDQNVSSNSGSSNSGSTNNSSTNNGSTNTGSAGSNTSANSGTNAGSTNSSSSGDSNKPGNNASDAGSNSNAGTAQKDGVKMYVEAINKAKSSATSVVKTKTSASHYKEHLVIDGNAIIKATLEPIGKSLMGTFMKASEPNETIDKNALPPQNIQCTLTQADVESVKTETSGGNTVVTLVLKGASDPKAGSGLGSAVSIIEEKTITDAVNGAIDISNIHLDYDPCTIIATIDGSGNLIALSVNAPCILKLTAMGVNAEVGIECYDEYTIAY